MLRVVASLLTFKFSVWQGCHAAITCPPSSVKFEKFCHHSQVSVPFPFHCDAVPLNYCHKGKYICFISKSPVLCFIQSYILADNLLQLNNSTRIYLDGNRIFDSYLVDDCRNDLTTTYSKHGHWQIKFVSIQNIYAVLVRTLGPASMLEFQLPGFIFSIILNCDASQEIKPIHFGLAYRDASRVNGQNQLNVTTLNTLMDITSFIVINLTLMKF